MYLIVINDATHSGAAIRFEVGSDSLAGRLGFSMKPPHFGAGTILRVGKAGCHVPYIPGTTIFCNIAPRQGDHNNT